MRVKLPLFWKWGILILKNRLASTTCLFGLDSYQGSVTPAPRSSGCCAPSSQVKQIIMLYKCTVVAKTLVKRTSEHVSNSSIMQRAIVRVKASIMEQYFHSSLYIDVIDRTIYFTYTVTE